MMREVIESSHHSYSIDYDLFPLDFRLMKMEKADLVKVIVCYI